MKRFILMVSIVVILSVTAAILPFVANAGGIPPCGFIGCEQDYTFTGYRGGCGGCYGGGCGGGYRGSNGLGWAWFGLTAFQALRPPVVVQVQPERASEPAQQLSPYEHGLLQGYREEAYQRGLEAGRDAARR